MVTTMEKRNLIDLRIDAGFERQSDLADAANLTKSTVWLAENGRTISRKSARKIVNALKNKGIEVEINDLNWSIAE